MNEADIREAVGRFFPRDKEQIGKKETADLFLQVLMDLGFQVTETGQQMRGGIVDIHHARLCLITPDGDGFHLLPLRVGQGVEVLADPFLGWQRCKVVPSAEGLAAQRLDVSDDVPVIGAPARVPLVLSGTCAGMAARQFPQIETGEGGFRNDQF